MRSEQNNGFRFILAGVVRRWFSREGSRQYQWEVGAGSVERRESGGGRRQEAVISRRRCPKIFGKMEGK